MAAPTSDSFVLADPEASMTPPAAGGEAGRVLAEGQTLDEKDVKYDEKYNDDDDDDEEEDLDSLPSISTSVLSPSESAMSTSSDAQREWEASLEQVQLMLTMVLVPLVGKFLGRKFAYWSWARYMEWAHEVDIRVTSKAAFNAVGAVEAVSSL